MSLTLQYIIIAAIFIIAIAYIVKKFLPSKGKASGCGKGCGCDYTKKDAL